MRRRRLSAAACACALLAAATPGFSHQGIDEQISGLSERIARDPRSGTLYLKRAELHRIHGDWTAAESDYVRARALDPDLVAAFLGLGRMLFESGRPEPASGFLDKYLAARPGDPEGYAARALVRDALGKPLDAARDWTEAIGRTTEPRAPRPEYFLGRADALAKAGDERLAEAIAGLEDGIRRLGGPITLELRALDLEMRIGRTEAALTRVQRLREGAQRKESWDVRRGQILEKVGRAEESREAYRKALDAIQLLPAARRATAATAEVAAAAQAGIDRLTKSLRKGQP